jgi:hypothetical protein
MEDQGWWTTVTFGTAYLPGPTPPAGPWRSREEAEEAVARWRRRLGYRAGTYEAASNLRIVGPFRTRAAAREADISDYPQAIRASWKEA